jgi:hypothetical protein
MFFTPTKGEVSVITNAGIVGSGTNIGTQVPEGATTNTYGAVTQLIAAASNTQDSWGVFVLVSATGASAAASQACVDILAGTATEDILIPGLLSGYSYGSGIRGWYFPVHVPGGTRISARLSTVRTAITDPTVAVFLYGGSPPPHRVGRKVTTYGTKIDNSRGQAVTPAASGGAASVTQMTASSSEDHFYFLPSFQAATDTTVTPNGFVNVGIGVGASTEQRIGSWWFAKDTNENMIGPMPSMGAFVDVPASTRFTLLVSNSGANDAAYDGLIHAVS